MTEEARTQGRGIGRVGRLATACLAWSVWALCVALLALTLMLDYLYTPPLTNLGDSSSIYQFFSVPLLVYATVGAFVASRRPENPVGWLLGVVGLVLAVLGFGTPYADYALLAEPAFPLPGAVYMACASQTEVALPVLISVAALLILLFPDGRMSDRSFRAVPWVVAGGGVTSALWALTSEAAFERYSLPNPLWVGGTLGEAVDMFGRLGTASVLVCLLVAVFLVFGRFDGARGAERQQIKWFAYAAAVLLVTLFFSPVIAWSLLGWIGFPLGVAGLCAIPVAVGIAVLRYRLYDIDRIINRTLVYVTLTAILAGVYVAGVAASQGFVRALTGQEQSQLAVVASTLVIAALFSPLRRGLQSFIDRRFYRRRYDARKTLEEFSVRLRDETDLDALNDDLVGVVRETVQPAYASLWLREPEGKRLNER